MLCAPLCCFLSICVFHFNSFDHVMAIPLLLLFRVASKPKHPSTSSPWVISFAVFYIARFFVFIASERARARTYPLHTTVSNELLYLLLLSQCLHVFSFEIIHQSSEIFALTQARPRCVGSYSISTRSRQTFHFSAQAHTREHMILAQIQPRQYLIYLRRW